MPSLRTALPFLLAATALTACGGAASGASSPSHRSTSQPEVHVGVDDTSFTGVPDSVHPGGLTLTFDNTGTTLHMAAIGLLGDGHTAADLTSFLASPEASAPPPWLSLVGGVDELDPGHTGSWSGSLAAGDYVLLSFVPDAQGVPEVADGFLAPFTAGGSVVHGEAPDATATVTLGPDAAALDLSAVPAGTTALALVNDGDAPRTVDVASIRSGKTYDDVVAEAQQGQGVPPSLIRLGGTAVAPHGRVVVGIEPAAVGTTYVVFDLDHVGEGAIDHETAG
ncbi:hypothetical protein [Petropleomorpha daqingensis]|uniref:Uncharacterized protein n=1 Tax=Petropleomorpha daqingensis TaxID=2026353 RepID=A0A853CKI6_9ACTN|nr:hypothetical protein [Petropleomorpha daqingensis]NYJ07379.1 hypothetical protein [Petropleomorpha daqingensis]